MVTRISSVILGANYGDEGKGLITDFETRRVKADVVTRFNGGAQAGHTVTTAAARHVFGHVGSGTFAGADTWFASKFIVNPFVLQKEMSAVRALTGWSPRIAVHLNARISTLYDMALNSLAELQRGDGRHGSCGLGINETVTRHEHYPITFSLIWNRSHSDLVHELQTIRTKWVPARLQALGITEVAEPYKSLFENDDLTSMASTMKSLMLIMGHRLPANASTVFEGAQGLALDEFLGERPHVTRSITGLPYAIVAAQELGIKCLQPVYVTRAYLTRHGAGAMAHEGDEFGAFDIVDNTNIHNPWQGTIRYAPLNLPMLAKYIAADQTRSNYVAQAHGTNLLPPTIALTCLDQLNGDVTIIDLDGTPKQIRTSALSRYLTSKLGYKISHISRGPTADDVEFLKFGV